MKSGARPVLVVSDLHLSRRACRSAAALAELLEQHPEHELVVAGDFFDLAFDPPSKDPAESIEEILGCHSELCGVLSERLARGVPVTLLAGNHDAAVSSEDTRARLKRVLGQPASVPLATFPWFVRRAGVHIEHGHFYDPDNAPNHPLCLWNPRTEPLGVAMTRRFVAPNHAMMFAGAYQVTPLAGLLQVLTEYRLRAPLVIANYFATAGGLCLRAHTQRATMVAESELGAQVLVEHSRALGVPAGDLEVLMGGGARPTHHRFRATFMRLYFDRIFAALGTATGLGIAAFGQPQGLLLAGVGAAYLVASVRTHGSRYSDLPGERLRGAAHRILETTDAKGVIFGHTHVEDAVPGYLNLGSFAFTEARERPYAEIDPSGKMSRRSLRA
ncbi:MAG TPA: metallophosphoesterase [Polyangiaceae bacterium]|nr:metallophosphoesterase [Polyangiaceae bacterium]